MFRPSMGPDSKVFLNQSIGVESLRVGALFAHPHLLEISVPADRKRAEGNVIKHRQETRRSAEAHASRQIIQGKVLGLVPGPG